MNMQFDLLDDGNIDNTTCIMIGAVNQYLISLKKEKRKKKRERKKKSHMKEHEFLPCRAWAFLGFFCI